MSARALPIVALVLAAWSGGTLAAGEEPPRPEDFAWGATIEVPSSHPLYELPLPLAVHQRAARADLGDLRVFNAAGEPVPHGLLPGALHVPQPPRLEALPLFPFSEATRRGSASVDVRIRQATGNTTVTVEGGGEPPDTERAWLVDARDLVHAPIALRLHWPRSAAPLTRRVTVEASDDLDRWRALATGITVADVTWAGERLLAERIELPRHRYHWYRLRPADGLPMMDLDGVSAELPASDDRGLAVEWLQVTTTPGEQPRRELRFDTPPGLPVAHVRVEPAERNTFLRARVEAGIDDQPWREAGRGSVYRLDFDDAVLRAAPLDVRAPGATRWRLLAEPGNGADFGASAPRVEVGWTPRSLVFLARGEGPFTLAFGSRRVAPVIGDGRRLLGDDVDILGLPRATVGTPGPLGDARRALDPSRDIDWKLVMLWAVLAGGTALLAFLAYRLMRKPS